MGFMIPDLEEIVLKKDDITTPPEYKSGKVFDIRG